MDIVGGKGICLGPNNFMGRGYQGTPIGITVEGANILTRSLIIFGQGVIRCHPYIYAEMESMRNQDVEKFDKSFFSHMAFVLANFTQTLIYGFTDGRGISTPDTSVKRYYQLLHRYSANLAFISDFAMAILGGELKRREKISARLGDMLSTLYLTSAVLKRFHDEGEPQEDLPLVNYSCQQLLFECEVAMNEVIRNFRPKWCRLLLRILMQPLGNRRIKPDDKLGHQLALLLTEPNAARDRLTYLAFKQTGPNCPVGRMEEAFKEITGVAELEKTVLKAARKLKFKGLTLTALIQEAQEANVINTEEARQLLHAESLRQQIIAVDDFADADLRRAERSKASKPKSEIV